VVLPGLFVSDPSHCSGEKDGKTALQIEFSLAASLFIEADYDYAARNKNSPTSPGDSSSVNTKL
jgi:hypothetical protein